MKKIFKSFLENLGFAAEAYGLAKNAPYYLVFKTTNYCWYKCRHCCENAGPDQEKTYIPEETICKIISQAKNDEKFIKEVVFTGGEIFSSYKFGDKQYVPNLLNFAIKNKLGVDIKTNAGWANTSFGQQIFDDLKKVITETRTNEYELPKLQISLSLDQYHTNCLENNMKVIKELAGLPVAISLSSFKGQEDLVKQFERKMSKTLKISKPLLALGGPTRQYRLLNGKTLYRSGFAQLFNGGRAIKIPEAQDTKHPEFTFVQLNGCKPVKIVAFDNFGRVTLGENSGRKIMTPYIDEYGQLKPLPKIFKELNRSAWNKCLYFTYIDQFFNPYTR